MLGDPAAVDLLRQLIELRFADEIEDLTSAKNAGYTEYRESQKREKELQTVKANIEKMLRLQEPEIGQERKKDEQEL